MTNHDINISTNCTPFPYWVRRSLKSVVMLLAVLLMSEAVFADTAKQDFPLRHQYRDLQIIDTETLFKNRDGITVVDVRSAYEFQTLHIENAVNISVFSPDFKKQVQNLHQQTQKPLVFYCNGHSCAKSYQAGRLAKDAAVFSSVYDSGVFDWAERYPRYTALLGKPLNHPSRLISEEEFKAHLLTPMEFSALKNEALVVDIRSAIARDGISLFVGLEKRIPLKNRKKLDRYLAIAHAEDKDILFYDATGKEVRWLQYYLQSKGVERYWFMKGGVREYFKYLQTHNNVF